MSAPYQSLRDEDSAGRGNGQRALLSTPLSRSGLSAPPPAGAPHGPSPPPPSGPTPPGRAPPPGKAADDDEAKQVVDAAIKSAVLPEERARSGSTWQHVKRLYSALKPERWWIFWATFFSVGSTGVSLVQPKLTGYFFNQLQYSASTMMQDADLSAAHYYLILMGVFYAGTALLSLATGLLFGLAGRKIVMRVRITLMRSYLAQNMAFFDFKAVGELMSRMSLDVSQLQSITTTLSNILTIVATVVISLVWMLEISWLLSIIVLATTPFLVGFSLFFGNLIRKLTTKIYDILAEQQQVANEVLTNIRTVRAYDQERREGNRFMAVTVRVYNLGWLLILYSQIYAICNLVVSYAASVLVFYFGANLVITQSLQYGDLIAFVSYAAKISGAVSGLSGMYTDLMKTVGGTQVLVSLLKMKAGDSSVSVNNTGDKVAAAPMQLGLIQGEIELRNVWFNYPTRPRQTALRHVNLEFHRGQMTAIVGPSGGGKSSLFSLLLRFYAPTRGTITLDGMDLQGVDVAWLRRNIAIVTQEPVIFTGTVFENISYGSLFATPEMVEAAAIKANCHDFIMELPQKYQTKIGPKETLLSGGQKQRVAVARALIKDAPILLLDEATSALDAHAELEVQRAIDELVVGRTVLVISHRLNTILKADRVAVIAAGEVRECGTHQELMQANGMYANMVRQQQAATNRSAPGPGGPPPPGAPAPAAAAAPAATSRL